MEAKDLGKTSTGIQANVAGLLCYLLGIVTGVVFILIEKDNKFVRFHAMQSIVAFGALFVLGVALGFLPLVGLPLLPVLWILEIILWVVLMIKAYQGEHFKLPIAGDIAEKQIGA